MEHLTSTYAGAEVIGYITLAFILGFVLRHFLSFLGRTYNKDVIFQQKLTAMERDIKNLRA